MAPGFVSSPPWPQPAVPWPLRAGAVALWCGLAGLALLALAYALPAPFSEVGWLSFPPTGLAALLGLAAVALAPLRQKALGLGALACFGAFALVLWMD